MVLAAGGAEWEAPALRLLEQDGVAVVRRCVDLPDLLAGAGTGTAVVAVVSGVLPGLDADAVVRLLRHDVRCVAVGGPAEALARIGVVHRHDPDDLPGLAEAVRAVVATDLLQDPDPVAAPLPRALDQDAAGRGRVVVVHGPAGAPGRTTTATALATLRSRTTPTVLLDADPYGGAVAQHLGLLDQVSGLLAAARSANAGTLDDAGFARCRRRVGERLDVLTGLPRPDRWVEVRPGALDTLIDRSLVVGDVVVDTGFSLEDDSDLGRSLSRNLMTWEALSRADAVVAVGSADPTGLARLARTLVELREQAFAPVTVVVNRMRESLGWERSDVVGMVEGYLRPEAVHFIPEDRAGVDRALVQGRAVVDVGETAARRAFVELHDLLWPVGPDTRRATHGARSRARRRSRR